MRMLPLSHKLIRHTSIGFTNYEMREKYTRVFSHATRCIFSCNMREKRLMSLSQKKKKKKTLFPSDIS